MKMTTLVLLLLVAGIGSASAADFEREGWPGEGVPGFSAKKSVLRLNKLSSKESEEITLPTKSGERITYDQSKMITKRSVTLTAKEKVTEAFCPGMPVPGIGQEAIIQSGETIEYLQYRAEGYVTARYKGVICEVFIADNNPKFDGLNMKPDVEWWIRVVNDKNVPLGWLLINEDQVNYLQRNL